MIVWSRTCEVARTLPPSTLERVELCVNVISCVRLRWRQGGSLSSWRRGLGSLERALVLLYFNELSCYLEKRRKPPTMKHSKKKEKKRFLTSRVPTKKCLY